MARKSQGNLDDEDVSILRTPIQLQGKPVEQILNSVHYGTPELQSLLLDECDIIFECKVCRALFRDLPNLISHKRRYCTKSATENNHIAISKIPDEKVYVIQPEAPESSRPKVSRVTRTSKPSLDETISRLQSGELGHSEAFKVYSDAADKLQRQKEEMKVATIRTRTIPTNSNAVFVDVNMASVNIHERPAASTNTSTGFSSSRGHSVITRKAREKIIVSKSKSPSKRARERILRKDCKNSEELQKLLMKELKEIQHKVKQRAQGNIPLKQSTVKGDSANVKNHISETVTGATPSKKASKPKDKESVLEELGLVKKRRKKSTPLKADIMTDSDTPNSKITNAESIEKKKKVLSPAPDMSLSDGAKLKSSKVTYKLRRKSLICQKCHKIFGSKQSLSFHNKIIHSPKKTFFPCLYCPSIFYYFYGVTRHLKMSHSKTNSEINSLRKQLRAKAYSKVLPEVKEPDVEMRATGLRKGLRNKQEAFSSETSPGSSYVLHSVKKMGKKLSAKKDALSSEVKDAAVFDELRSGQDKGRYGNFGSDSNVKSPVVKKEIERSSYRRSQGSSPKGICSPINPTKRRKLEYERKKSPMALTTTSKVKKNLVHTCKKCRRVFGRILTYKNHIKVCQGKSSSLARGRRRGKPRKELLQQDKRTSKTVSPRNQKEALSLRGRKVVRAEKTPPLTSLKTCISSNSTPPPSNQSTRSSSRETIESERLSRQLESETELVNHNNKDTDIHLRGTKSRSSSVPRSTSKLNVSTSMKSERRESRTPERQMSQSLERQTKYEEKAFKGPSQDNISPAMLKDEKIISLVGGSDNSTSSSTSPKITVSQKVASESPQANVSLVQKDTTTVSQAGKAESVSVTSKGMKGLEPSVSENFLARLRSVAPDVCKDHRSNSVERDVRSKISHLIPRASADEISHSDKELSTSKPSNSPITDRPRRKRKVPTRNMDAVEMFSKIHNPEQDGPPSKKRTMCQGVGLTTAKTPKGTPPPNSKEAGSVKSQTPTVKVEREHKDEEMQDEVEDIKEGRLTKSRSRIFVLGRSKPRGRKHLHSYDNARVDKLIDIQNSKCLVCGEYYTRIFNLRRHVIRIHLQWSRYQCKLCRFASFDRSECTTHIVRNHRRAVNGEDTHAVNSCITDLAKQGSQAMTKKKNQTLRDKKSRQQNKESNIYARPNVRKMPRLAERTLIQEKGQLSDSSSCSSPQFNQKSDDNGPSALKSKTVRQLRMADTIKDVSENCNLLRKPSLPFNISTRNSPRMFDTRPFKTQENSSPDTQGEVVVLHTRKGIYTKTVPAVSSKEKSDSEVIVESRSAAGQKGDDRSVKEKSTLKMEINTEINSLPNHNIFDKMGLVNIPENRVRDKETNVDKIVDSNLGVNVLPSEEIQGEVKSETTSQGYEENKTRLTDTDTETCVTKMSQSVSVQTSDESLSHLSTSSVNEPKVRNLKESNKDILVSPFTVSDPSGSPNRIRISPSYVVLKSARLPPTSLVGTASTSAVKTLNFSNNISLTVNSVDSNGISNYVETSRTKTTLLDDIAQESKQSSQLLSIPSTEQSLSISSTEQSLSIPSTEQSLSIPSAEQSLSTS